MHRLSERFAHQHRFGPPPSFRRASPYPSIDRPASGIPPMTPGEHTSSLTPYGDADCWFPSGYAVTRLTSPLIRTPWPVILNGRYNVAPQSTLLLCLHAISAYSCLVSGSFNLPSGVLFSFHSRYYFTIGLGSYLELEVYASHIHARYPTHTTQDPFFSHELTITGLSPFIALHSRRFHVRSLGKEKVYNTTSPTIHHSGIQFALYRFRSPLLTASLLISFPAGTKMLQSPAFPIITDHTEV